MTKLLILDLDGTVRHPLVRENGTRPEFTEGPTDQELMPGVSENIRRFKEDSWTIVAATNQGGVAYGKKTLSECYDEQLFTLFLAPEIERVFLCPDKHGNEMHTFPNGDISKLTVWYRRDDRDGPGFRKPQPGMLLHAIKLYQPTTVLMVGDRMDDFGAAEKAGVNFMWAQDFRRGAFHAKP